MSKCCDLLDCSSISDTAPPLTFGLDIQCEKCSGYKELNMGEICLCTFCKKCLDNMCSTCSTKCKTSMDNNEPICSSVCTSCLSHLCEWCKIVANTIASI